MRRLPTLLAILLTFTACRGADSDLPSEYRSLKVPEARLGSEEARARGRALFEKNCVLCHGERGNGHGRRSAALSPRPPDFTSPQWRARTSPRRAYFVIREGVRGTAMPSWKWLGEDDAWDLVSYVLSLAATSSDRGGAS
jgi:mono/diheme cytochrome c family protein